MKQKKRTQKWPTQRQELILYKATKPIQWMRISLFLLPKGAGTIGYAYTAQQEQRKEK